MPPHVGTLAQWGKPNPQLPAFRDLSFQLGCGTPPFTYINRPSQKAAPIKPPALARARFGASRWAFQLSVRNFSGSSVVRGFWTHSVEETHLEHVDSHLRSDTTGQPLGICHCPRGFNDPFWMPPSETNAMPSTHNFSKAYFQQRLAERG